jgi:hypothetical protein
MCLNSVIEVLKAPQKRVVKAYKYFDLSSGRADSERLHLPFRYFNRSGTFFERNLIRQDVWLKAEHVELQADNRMQVYTSGFHAISEKVKLWEVYTFEPAVLIEVYLYGVRVKGTEHDRPCVVADWLYVPSDPEAAAPAAPTSERKPRAHTATTAKAKQPKL